jgi:hypothetical protein
MERVLGNSDAVFLDEREASQQFAGVFDAVVTRSTSDHLWFVIPEEFSTVLEFGPARYPRFAPVETEIADLHVHEIDAGAPPDGTEVLIAFAAGDPARPRVINFLGWPS